MVKYKAGIAGYYTSHLMEDICRLFLYEVFETIPSRARYKIFMHEEHHFFSTWFQMTEK